MIEMVWWNWLEGRLWELRDGLPPEDKLIFADGNLFTSLLLWQAMFDEQKLHRATYAFLAGLAALSRLQWQTEREFPPAGPKESPGHARRLGQLQALDQQFNARRTQLARLWKQELTTSTPMSSAEAKMYFMGWFTQENRIDLEWQAHWFPAPADAIDSPESEPEPAVATSFVVVEPERVQLEECAA